MTYKSLTTDSNFDEGGGSFSKIETGGQYSLGVMEAQGTFDWSPNISTSLQIDYNSAASTDGTTKRTSSKLSRVHLSGQYFLYKRKKYQIIPQIRIGLPMLEIKSGVNEVLTDEPSTHIEVGSWAQGSMWGLQLYSYLSYLQRNEGFADLGLYKFGVVKKIGRFNAQGGLSGFITLTEDALTNVPNERTDITDRVNGGSRAIYSINPERLAVDLSSSYRFNRSFGVAGGIDIPLNGANTSNDPTYWVKLDIFEAFIFGQPSPKRLSNKPVRKVDPKNLGFEVDEEENPKEFNELEAIPPEVGLDEQELGDEVEQNLEKRNSRRKKRLRSR